MLPTSAEHSQYAARPSVCIGVCTRRRPGMLGRLLASFVRMALPDTVQVSVCVVENDRQPHNEALVRGFAASAPFGIDYCLESRIGIPQARNRLLDHASSIGATALVFVDDDEEVTREWLQELCGYAFRTGWRAVLQGHVISRLDPVGHHLEPYFQRKCRTTGEQLSYCATNNTLLPLALAGELRFDESRPSEGGEDTIFFAELKLRGIDILYCGEAVVIETIPPERANLRYLSRRKFRVGLLLGGGGVGDKRRTLLRSAFYAVKSFASLLQALLYALVFQRAGMIRAWLRSCRSLGCCLGYFPIHYSPYRRIEGY